MKRTDTDKGFITFSSPEPTNNTIFVKRVHPDYTTEVIGKIYPKFNSEEDTINYISTNNQGEEIFPPTSDFTEIENRFIHYAKEQSEKSFTEAMLKEAEKPNKRKEALRTIRNIKFKDFGFNKSYLLII